MIDKIKSTSNYDYRQLLAIQREMIECIKQKVEEWNKCNYILSVKKKYVNLDIYYNPDGYNYMFWINRKYADIPVIKKIGFKQWHENSVYRKLTSNNMSFVAIGNYLLINGYKFRCRTS